MNWRILGPIEVRNDLGPVDLRAPKQRLLLGILLLHPRTPLPTAMLIDCLWADRRPRSARANLHSYVGQLRRALGDDRLASTPDGYRLRVDHDELDADIFERLVTAGNRAATVREAAATLDDALSLWRGDVLAGIELPPQVRPLASRLNDLRLTATEDWVDASMRAADRPDPLAEIVQLAEAHPLRERFQAQLLLALHRAGRTSEALAGFRRFRDRLIDELGVEPGPPLQELHRSILAGDPALLEPEPAPVQATAPVESASTGKTLMGRGDAPPPRTLPPDVPHLVGRDPMLQKLDALSVPGAVIVLDGIPGTGKTALATHWAHRVAGRFPDGQLHVDLHGWSTDAPMPPLAALTGCLRALGVPGSRIPVDLADAVALYRSTVAGQRLLLVLDNARDAEQVRPLLPSGGQCVTVVTSRNRLVGLVAVNHARRLTVEPLAHADAVALLREALGRTGPPDGALAALADACGRLPLALRIAAARCSDRPEEDLSGAGGLAALDAGDDPQASVRAAFALSYRQLSDPHRVLFRRLGLTPGRDLGVSAAAALGGVDGVDIATALDALVTANLVERTRTRYALHDLLRAYAREEADRADPPEARAAAFERLCHDYRAGVDGAARILYDHMLRLPPDGAEPRAFVDADAALSWLDAELANLVAVIRHAAEHGPRPAAWQLADGLRGYFWQRRTMADWLAATESGLTAAEESGDPGAIAAMRLSLGQATRSLGRSDEADAHLAAALPASVEAGWPQAEASILGHRAVAHAERGDNLRALALLERVLDVNRKLGRAASVGITLGNLGTLRYQLGDLRGSCDDMAAARRLAAETGNAGGLAIATTNLGITTVFLGDYEEAGALLADGMRRYEALGDPAGLTLAHFGLARLHGETGDAASAGRHAQLAADLAERAGDTGSAATCASEAALWGFAAGDRATVVERCTAAVTRARGAGTMYAEAWTLVALADAHRCTGRPEPAVATAEEALALARHGSYRLLAGEANRVLAEAHLDAGNAAPAVAAAEAAVADLRACGYERGWRRAAAVLARARPVR